MFINRPCKRKSVNIFLYGVLSLSANTFFNVFFLKVSISSLNMFSSVNNFFKLVFFCKSINTFLNVFLIVSTFLMHF